MSQPQGTAPALGQPSAAPEPVDFSEALLTSEKLPSDLPDDAPAGVSQVSLSVRQTCCSHADLEKKTPPAQLQCRCKPSQDMLPQHMPSAAALVPFPCVWSALLS